MKLCIVDCEDNPMWIPITFGDMFASLLAEPTDQCTIVNVAKGDQLLEVTDFDGLVITGSHYNCRDYQNIPWFNNLCDSVKRIYEQGTPKLYGGCFGCQLIAFALGGVVDFNPHQRVVLKSELISIDHDNFVKHLGSLPSMPEKINLIEVHQDCVREIPPGSIRLASSASCDNEIYVTGKNKKNILACQSHPEFDYDYAIRDRLFPRFSVELNRLSTEEIEEAKQSFEEYSRLNGADFMIEIIKKFLHNNKLNSS